MENETNNGCGTFAAIGMAIVIVLAVLLTSCKSVQPITNTRDSVRVEYRLDSVYFFQHDSVFRDRWHSGDTIFVQVEKWRTRYKDKIVLQHDTICTEHTEQVPVKYVPAYYKNTSAGFWVLLAILLLIIGVKVAKIYLKIQSGGVWKL